MPNQNQPDPNQGAPQSAAPPSFSPQSDLPPLPPDFQKVTEEVSVPGGPTDQSANQPVSEPSGSAAPPDINISSVISKPKKRFGTGKIIATILGIFLLVDGVGAGIVLTQQPQLLQQKAATCLQNGSQCSTGPCCSGYCNSSGRCDNPPATTTISCSTSGSCVDPHYCCSGYDCNSQNICVKSTSLACTAEKVTACRAANEDCQANASGGVCVATPEPSASTTLACTAEKVAQCHAMTPSEDCQANSSGGVCVPRTASTAACTLDGNDIIVGNSLSGNCYQGGVGNAYACHKLTGNHGEKITGCTDGQSCSCTCPSPYTYQRDENGAWWCFNTAAGELPGQAPYAEQCSAQPQQCTSASPTPTGSSVPAAPYCVAVKAYDSTWTAMDNSGLSALTTGSVVNFCVSGSAPSGTFDMAQFTIDGVQLATTTTQRPSSTDYCQSYTILSTDTTVTVTARIHHSTLGWF